MAKKKIEEKEKTRYSDADLLEFKQLILGKLSVAKDEFGKMQRSLQNPNENGDENTSNQYLTLDDGASTFEKENLNQLAARQKKFIDNLEAALIRIENKTYGNCEECGSPIGKARLQVFPRATLCMLCKQKEERR